VICPTGSFSIPLSSSLCKNISLFPKPKSVVVFAVPPPQEGRIAIVTDVGSGMRWTQRCRETSALMRTAKSCGPGAPTLALSFCGKQFLRKRRGQKSPVPGESTKYPLKPLRREGPRRAPPVVTTVCFLPMHTGRGCELAPGLPCALLFSRVLLCKPRAHSAPREREVFPVYRTSVFSSSHTSLSRFSRTHGGPKADDDDVIALVKFCCCRRQVLESANLAKRCR
jgi:hypothetical protein